MKLVAGSNHKTREHAGPAQFRHSVGVWASAHYPFHYPNPQHVDQTLLLTIDPHRDPRPPFSIVTNSTVMR